MMHAQQMYEWLGLSGHVGPDAHFPPYPQKQTTLVSSSSKGARFSCQRVDKLEAASIETRTGTADQIRFDHLAAVNRPRPPYTPPTPPLTPHKSTSGRGHSHARHREAVWERDPSRLDSCPSSIDNQSYATSASVPLYVNTSLSNCEAASDVATGSASPRNHVVEFDDDIGELWRHRVMDDMRRVYVNQEREDDIRPIPLQDPPKSKLKRQFPEEDSEQQQQPVDSTSPVKVRCPARSPKPPRTPQPEAANTRFSFYENPSEDASLTRGYPVSSQCQTLYRRDVHGGNMSPKRLRPEENVSMRVLVNDNNIGSMSPKRIKGENGRPMSPLIQKQSNQWPRPNTEPLVFRFPDVSTMYNRASPQTMYEHSEMVYSESRPRHIPPWQLEGQVRQDNDAQIHTESIRYHESYYGVKPGPFISRPTNFETRSPLSIVREKSSPEKFKRMNYYPDAHPCPCETCTPVYSKQTSNCLPKQTTNSLPTQITFSPQKQTLRSHSNVDHSPNKAELEEMEEERYFRSLSKPEGQHGLHVLQRQMNARERLRVKESPLLDMHQDDCVYSYKADDPPQTTREYNACRQLFANPESSHPRRRRMEVQHGGGLTHDTSLQQPLLCRSYDDYDVYIVPRSNQTLPGYSGNEDEGVHLQKRRQTISCPRDATRPYSPQKGRSSPGQQQPRGTLNVRLNVQDVARDEKEFCEKLKRNSPTCTCERVQDEILKIATIAFANAQRKDTGVDSFDRSTREIHATNSMLADALATAKALKELCGRHKKIHDIYPGSVVIAIQCLTLVSIENLREQYKSGELHQLLYKTFLTERLKRKFGVKYVMFSVKISDADFRRCTKELEESMTHSPVRKKTPVPVFRLSPLKRESKSVDDLENIPSYPQLPVRMRSSTSTPSLLMLSPAKSPCYAKSPTTPTTPTTPTKRSRFSFCAGDRRTRTMSPGFRERKNSLSSLTESCSRRTTQFNNGDRSPCSPSVYSVPIFENQTYPPQQPSPRLRKSLEDITSDLANIHT